jgi:nitrile hydratase
MNGAKVVARAWVDPEYKARLLQGGTAAVAELGFGGPEGNIVAVANEPGVHNVVVCTLCSCYPWSILGLPPTWYKDAPYRARMVREPRVLLREMGCVVPDDVDIRVWDSSAEVRYLVVPERPAGAEGLPEEERGGTRDARLDDRRGTAVNTDLLDTDGVATPPRRKRRTRLRSAAEVARIRAMRRDRRDVVRRRPGTVPPATHRGDRGRT